MVLMEYQVLGRHLPTAQEPNPKLYRMRIFAKNEVVAKSRFWYFLRCARERCMSVMVLTPCYCSGSLKRSKKPMARLSAWTLFTRNDPSAQRTLVSGCVMTHVQERTTCTRFAFGFDSLKLSFQDESMLKEYRELSRADAVRSMYQDMAARHRARFRSIHVCYIRVICLLHSLTLKMCRFSVLWRLTRRRTCDARTSSSSWLLDCASLFLIGWPRPNRRLLRTGRALSRMGSYYYTFTETLWPKISPMSIKILTCWNRGYPLYVTISLLLFMTELDPCEFCSIHFQKDVTSALALPCEFPLSREYGWIHLNTCLVSVSPRHYYAVDGRLSCPTFYISGQPTLSPLIHHVRDFSHIPLNIWPSTYNVVCIIHHHWQSQGACVEFMAYRLVWPTATST